MQRYFLWVMVGTLILLAAEILTGRHKAAYNKGDAPLLIGSLILGRAVVIPAVTVLIAGVYGLLLPQHKNALHHAPFWVAFPILLLVSEFCFYWVHRFAHATAASRVPLLWKIHRTHHSGRHMNITLLYRLNLFWYFILPNSWIGGLAVYLGLDKPAAAVALLLMTWNAITHAHFRWDDPIRRNKFFGPVFRALEHVIISPGVHHTHHGFGRDGASYRNFALFFAFYDWIFGTLHIPSGRPFRYGIPGRDAHWIEQLFYPLVRFKEPRSDEV